MPPQLLRPAAHQACQLQWSLEQWQDWVRFEYYIVMTVLAIVIIKKNYKRCTKGRRRTPWKYNPVDLMSFES
jgi:hypothetical protein